MSETATASAATTGAPGTILLWVHAGLYILVGLAGYFAMEALFGTAALQPTASVAVKWLSAALIVLALVFATAARSGSADQVKIALIGAFLLDFQAPVVMARYPGMLHHIEFHTGMLPGLLLLPMFLLAGVTAYQLSRLWRTSKHA